MGTQYMVVKNYELIDVQVFSSGRIAFSQNSLMQSAEEQLQELDDGLYRVLIAWYPRGVHFCKVTKLDIPKEIARIEKSDAKYKLNMSGYLWGKHGGLQIALSSKKHYTEQRLKWFKSLDIE